MTRTIDTIREFHTTNFSIIIDAIEDDSMDLSWDETGEVLEQIESGELMHFTVRARVMYDGEEIASDYLGGCIHATPAEFMDHRECGRSNRELAASGKSGRCGSYFTDMVSTVCADARKHFAKMQEIRVRKVAA